MNIDSSSHKKALTVAFLLLSYLLLAQHSQEDSAFITQNYTKIERLIPVQDGIRLFTAIYSPKVESG